MTYPRAVRAVLGGVKIRVLGAVGLCLLLTACFQQSPSPANQPRYQITRMNDNHALIIDGTTGDVWYWVDAPIGVSLRYMGKVRPGSVPGDMIAEFKLF
jgi:hypothetical protein